MRVRNTECFHFYYKFNMLSDIEGKKYGGHQQNFNKQKLADTKTKYEARTDVKSSTK